VQPQRWLAIILIYTVITLLSAYLIPADSIAAIIRYVLGFSFVIFVPGYCLINFLFADGKLDFPEVLVLSVALSFSVAGISGLFIGISPIGLNIRSITITLSAIVVVLALLAFLRKIGCINLRLPKRNNSPEAPAQNSN
jgi:uncharacterized membrane protein